MKAIAANFAVFIILGCIWFILHHALHIPDYFLPGMGAVYQSLITNHVLLFTGFANSFLEAILGLGLACLLALVLGVCCYFSPILLRIVHPLVLVSQALPVLAIAPLIVLWLGIGLSSKLVVIVLSLFFPIFANFVEGLTHVNPLLIDLAYTMQATKLRRFVYLDFPAILPHLAAGIKVAVTWSILAAIVAEWVGGSTGLGFIMQNALSRLDTPLLFAALIVLVFGTLLFYAIVAWGVQSINKR